MPQSDHHLQYAGPGDTKPTLGQFNTSVDATVFSKIYMVCLIGKIVLEICLVPLIWLNILKSTNQNRECFSGGTTIKLIFLSKYCLWVYHCHSLDYENYKFWSICNKFDHQLFLLGLKLLLTLHEIEM